MIAQRLARAFDLTNGLARQLDAPALRRRNGAAPSNTIGGQFWCLVGARESYSKAIEAGRWSGFACSLSREGAQDPGAVLAALDRSGRAALDAIGGGSTLTDARLQLAFDLLEHECQHHGQLIRFFYAKRLAFPEAFAKRYALAPGRGA